MRFSSLAFVTVAVLGALPGLAWAGDTQDTPANDPNRVSCEMSPPPVGTRIGGSRICHTQQEWNEIHAAAQKTVNDLQNNGLKAQTPGGGG